MITNRVLERNSNPFIQEEEAQKIDRESLLKKCDAATVAKIKKLTEQKGWKIADEQVVSYRGELSYKFSLIKNETTSKLERLVKGAATVASYTLTAPLHLKGEYHKFVSEELSQPGFKGMAEKEVIGVPKKEILEDYHKSEVDRLGFDPSNRKNVREWAEKELKDDNSRYRKIVTKNGDVFILVAKDKVIMVPEGDIKEAKAIRYSDDKTKLPINDRGRRTRFYYSLPVLLSAYEREEDNLKLKIAKDIQKKRPQDDLEEIKKEVEKQWKSLPKRFVFDPQTDDFQVFLGDSKRGISVTLNDDDKKELQRIYHRDSTDNKEEPYRSPSSALKKDDEQEKTDSIENEEVEVPLESKHQTDGAKKGKEEETELVTSKTQEESKLEETKKAEKKIEQSIQNEKHDSDVKEWMKKNEEPITETATVENAEGTDPLGGGISVGDVSNSEKEKVTVVQTSTKESIEEPKKTESIGSTSTDADFEDE